MQQKKKTALWITSGLLAHARGRARAHPCQLRSLGGPSISPPRRTTPITQSRSQRQQLDHSRVLPRACLFISETNVIATVAMVTLHLPVCLRAEQEEWKQRWRQAEREVAVSVLHSVYVREIYLTSCTLFKHWGHPKHYMAPTQQGVHRLCQPGQPRNIMGSFSESAKSTWRQRWVGRGRNRGGEPGERVAGNTWKLR